MLLYNAFKINNPLKYIVYAAVIALYFSYPAVSHICAFTLPPDANWTVAVANSTPIVGNVFSGASSLVYLYSRWVFPTPASPIRTTNFY